MNEVVLKILAQIALNQGDIPKLIKQLQAEVAKAAGVEIPVRFQKPPSDASIRSLIQRSREEFSLQGIKSPTNTQLLQQLQSEASRQGLFEKFQPEQIQHLAERQLQLENLKREEVAKLRLAQLEEKQAKQREANLLRQAQLEERNAKQRENTEFRNMQIQEKLAKAGLGRSDTSKLLDSVINEMKFKRLPEFEEAAARKRKFEFDPYSPENRQEAITSARTRLAADPRFAGNTQKTAQAMAHFEEQMNLRRMRSLEFLGKTAGQTGMQITATSNYLLAASSILRPLSPMLSNLAMSAGFAAFSLGAIPAALTGAAAGIGGWIALLKISSAEATKAGLATREWKEATFQYNTTVKALLITIGRDVQREFEPVVDIFEELTDKLVDLPWHDFIKATADSAEVLLKLTLAMERFAQPAIKLVDIMSESGVLGGMINPIGSPGAKTSMDWIDKLFGLSTRTDKDRPPYFPGNAFHIRDVRDVGSSIQQSILKTTVQDQILAETVKANEQRQETNEILRKGFQKGVNSSTGIPAIRNLMFPWISTAESM